MLITITSNPSKSEYVATAPDESIRDRKYSAIGFNGDEALVKLIKAHGQDIGIIILQEEAAENDKVKRTYTK